MKPRVVVVDDSLTVRMDIGDALQSAGFEIVLCCDLRTAREALSREGTALVVLDIQLPDGDGVDFLKEMRNAGATAEIPVLLLSTEAEVKNRVRGMDAGANEYVGKPYDLGQVVARARALTRAGSRGAKRAGPRVLLIDDSVTFREELRESLEAAGYQVRGADTGEEGLAMAAADRPDAVIVDGKLPGIDGAAVVRRLKSDAALRSTPCLLLTAAEGPGEEMRALDAGADTYVRKTEDLGVILVRLAALLRGTMSNDSGASPSLLGPKRLLAIDDSMTYLQELGGQLRQEGYDVVLATSGEEGLALLAAQPVDCILLDLIMPGLSGQDTCRRIKQRAEWRDIPLVMLTARDGREAMIDGINAGADDYIAKSGDFDVLKARLRAQLRRRHFEDENRRIRETLVRRETEARFQRLFHSNIIGVLVADLAAARVTDANDAFLVMVGYSRAELVAGSVMTAAITPPEWRERTESAIAEVRRIGSTTPFETEYLRRDGSRLPVLLGLVLMEGTDSVIGFVLDRTEQKSAEEKLLNYAAALEKANRELLQAQRQKAELSALVVHDLKSPLTAILANVQFLSEAKLEHEQRDAVSDVLSSAESMHRMVLNLLDISRSEDGTLLPKLVEVDIDSLVKQACGVVRRRSEERRLTLSYQVGVKSVRADKDLLQRLIENLLDNGIKYSPAGSSIQVRVQSADDGCIEIRVSDEGLGVPEASRQRIFEKYVQLDPDAATDARSSRGLGLAFCRLAAEAHGGRIWVEENRPKGSSFCVRIPTGS